METKETPISPKTLIQHGYHEYKAKNGTMYWRNWMAVTYNKMFWQPCCLINGEIFVQLFYFDTIEQIERFAKQ